MQWTSASSAVSLRLDPPSRWQSTLGCCCRQVDQFQAKLQLTGKGGFQKCDNIPDDPCVECNQADKKRGASCSTVKKCWGPTSSLGRQTAVTHVLGRLKELSTQPTSPMPRATPQAGTRQTWGLLGKESLQDKCDQRKHNGMCISSFSFQPPTWMEYQGKMPEEELQILLRSLSALRV